MSAYYATPKAFSTAVGAITIGAASTNGPALNVYIHGLVLVPAAAASSVAVTDAGGNTVAQAAAVASGASVDQFYNVPAGPLKGPITITPAGTGATGIIYYSLG